MQATPGLRRRWRELRSRRLNDPRAGGGRREGCSASVVVDGGVPGQVFGDGGSAVSEPAAEGTAVNGAGGLDVLEGDRLAGVLAADGSAEESVAVEGDVLADVGGEGGSR